MPFNWRTPVGFLACFLIETIIWFTGTQIYIAIVILTIGFCTFAVGFGVDLEKTVNQLQQDINALQHDKLSIGKTVEIKVKLSQFIRFHSTARELSSSFFSPKND